MGVWLLIGTCVGLLVVIIGVIYYAGPGPWKTKVLAATKASKSHTTKPVVKKPDTPATEP